jgi:hypothetical protein
LVSSGADNPFWDLLPDVPQGEVVDLCLRGVAFLCGGSPDSWLRLLHRFEDRDEWGSILASFSEYANVQPCASEILDYVDHWLMSPEKVGNILIWDLEVRSLTVLENRLSQVRRDRGQYLLRILDATAFVTEHDGGDWGSFVPQHLRRMSLVLMRERVAKFLADEYREGSVEALVAFLATSDHSSGEALKALEDITHAGLVSEFEMPEIRADKWIKWWKKHAARMPSAMPLNEAAPTMARALEALLDASPTSAYMEDHVVVRRSLALNPNARPAELLCLSRDDNGEVRRIVATRDGLPYEAVTRLANDANVVVRRHLASNKTIGYSALSRLTNDEDETTRENAANVLAS